MFGDEVLDEQRFAMVARVQQRRAIFTVRTSMRDGSAVLGRVTTADTYEIDQDGSVDFESTLPTSMFSVDSVRFEHSTGRYLLAMQVHGFTASGDDLNSPTSALGRLVRYALVQRLANAAPTPIDFSPLATLAHLRRVAGV